MNYRKTFSRIIMKQKKFYWFATVIFLTSLSTTSCVTLEGWIIPEDVKLTAAKHDGNFGGYQAMNSWLQANGCEGYHVCDYTEASRWMQTNGPSIFIENCWINSPGVYYGAGSGNVGDCRGWSSSHNEDVGTIIARSAGKTFPGRHYCYRVFKVACCK